MLLSAFAIAPFTSAQQTPPTRRPYTPPTHREKFQAYVSQTYSVGSLLEAGVDAGISQALHQPIQWQEGATGYAMRFGSAAGEIIVRGTTEYGLGEIFREDLRRFRDPGTSKFQAALEDTFTARKGADGHHAFSVARILGPISGGFVAETWKPGGHNETAKGIAITYGLVFVRNLIFELSR